MSRDIIVIKNSLDFIIRETFGDNLDYVSYHISIVPKEMKKKHAHYIIKERKIEIFNLTRPPKHLLFTCLHEVAHHIQQMRDGHTDHELPFYEILFELVKQSISLTFLTIDDVVSEDDAADAGTLINYFGESDTWDIQESNRVHEYVVTVKNGYHFQNLLKKLEFDWLSISTSWEKDCDSLEQAERLRDYLLEKTNQKLEIEFRKKYDLEFAYYYYLAVSNGYDYRKELKERGYIFEGYGHQNSQCWVKKLLSRDYYDEIVALTQFNGIQYKRVQSKPIKKPKVAKKVADDKPKGKKVFIPIFND